MWAAPHMALSAAAEVQVDETWLNLPTLCLFLAVLGILVIVFLVGLILKRQPETTVNPAIVEFLTRP